MHNSPPQPAAKQSDIVRFGGGAILVILSLLGVMAIGMTIGDIAHYFDVEDWAQVEATVVQASIREDHNESGSLRHRPVLKYSFEVDGTVFEADSAEDSPWMSRADAQTIIDAHPRGGTVPVFFDPEKPKHSTLDPDPPLLQGVTLGFLLPTIGYILYFCGWLIPTWIRDRRARP